MLGLGKAAARHVATMIFRARALKEMETFPTDYTSDVYWT
jgi:hypothetical protein